MTEDERDEICDLLPGDMVIWGFDDELEHFAHADMHWWMEALGHERSGENHSCCKKCGCATTCVAAAFHDSMISSVIRELDKLGLLKRPEMEEK